MVLPSYTVTGPARRAVCLDLITSGVASILIWPAKVQMSSLASITSSGRASSNYCVSFVSLSATVIGVLCSAKCDKIQWPDGAETQNRRTLASASKGKTIRIWYTSTGAHDRTLEGHDATVDAVVFSPDGEKLASASSDNTIILWQVAAGWHSRILKNHLTWIGTLRFSVDSKYLQMDFASFTTSSTSQGGGREDQPVCFVLSTDEQWITVRGQDYLWLPADYRATAGTVRGDTIVIGHQSGSITFLRFSLR